jgi:hypothetical protein
MELDVAQGVFLGPGEGERLNERIVVKIERPEISVNEVTVGPEFEGPGPHFHKEHVDAFYVLEGQLEFTDGTETLLAPVPARRLRSRRTSSTASRTPGRAERATSTSMPLTAASSSTSAD